MDHETQHTGRCMFVSKNWTWKKIEYNQFYRSSGEINFGGVVIKVQYKLGQFVGFSLNALSCVVQ